MRMGFSCRVTLIFRYSTLRQSKGDVPESKLNQCVQELDEAEQKLEQCRVGSAVITLQSCVDK